ncbi:CHAT domain-containing protein [Nocardia asteroides]|uniref:CHAT domain-containing protein n=1 Tax=Nocardia asteroides TaxID=1824 RepID=UPI001E53E40C|nr:CHAT domain-containing protein [Nocardia asteroides]UGT61882.1 CHAT domain-containing protein [Nocardia asteroides]
MEFEAAASHVRPVRFTLPDPGRIAAVRRQLHNGLLEVKRSISALTVPDSDIPILAQALGSMGRRMIFTLIGNQSDLIRELQLFWRSAVPTWRNPGHVAVVECLGDTDRLLPLEYLPFFDMGCCTDEIGGRADFVASCRSFVGFSCIVRRRVLPIPVPAPGHGLAVDTDGKVVLRYLHHDTLIGAAREYKWFTTDGSAKLSLRGPYPNSEQRGLDIAERIYDPESDQIQHFSCHCDTTAPDPLDYRLELRGAGRDLDLTLGELGEHLVRFGATVDRGIRDMPLVVLNACGSSRVDPSSSISFPQVFLQNGNRGCIGTEIAIPDEEAAEFSRVFYRELLEGGSVGVAAHRSRNHLLHDFTNPIGLAYTVYGDTDLAITE